jgi:hypothetical protein
MKLTKNGEIIDLPNKSHCDAFMDAGWIAYVEPIKVKAKTATEDKKNKRKRIKSKKRRD